MAADSDRPIRSLFSFPPYKNLLTPSKNQAEAAADTYDILRQMNVQNFPDPHKEAPQSSPNAGEYFQNSLPC